ATTPSTTLVPPAMASTPCAPPLNPTYTSAACHKPLETVNCPTPESAMIVSSLVAVSSPPVIQTAPVAAARLPMCRNDVSVLVPPATVNVPCEPVFVPTYISRARNVPLEIVICPTPWKPTTVELLVMLG